jgi:hypothetical protein
MKQILLGPSDRPDITTKPLEDGLMDRRTERGLSLRHSKLKKEIKERLKPKNVRRLTSDCKKQAMSTTQKVICLPLEK